MRDQAGESNAREPRNDIQRHLLKKVQQAADDYRASRRQLATDVVDAIASGFAAGLSREQIIDDLAAGMTTGWAKP